MIYLYGRDEMESLYIVPKEVVYPNNINDLIKKILNKEQYRLGFTTSVVETKSFLAERLSDVVGNLYKTLDSKVVIGQSQIIFLGEEKEEEQQEIIPDNIFLREIEYAIKEQKWDTLKDKFLKLINKLEKEKCPQLWVERYVRQIIYAMQMKHPFSFCDDYEFMIEDAFFYAENMKELYDSLVDIFYKCIMEDSTSCIKADTRKFIESIKDYLYRHMSEPITLQAVCREFGISQTYLSKLFRKYEDKTFNNYLTTIRIKRAIELMEENKDFYVKDIAAMVGYHDQFYFSRVFCSIIGTPPSVYAETCYK